MQFRPHQPDFLVGVDHGFFGGSGLGKDSTRQ
jgi:hypothetical protein